MNNSINTIPTGIFTLTIRDANTLAVKRVHEDTNEITIGGIWSSFLGASKLSDASEPGFQKIFVAEGELPQSTQSFWKMGEIDPTTDLEDSETQAWTAVTTGTPVYAEKVGRFNSPVATRSINVIGLCDNDSTPDCGTIAVLTTPCIQNPGEVLDITYRIQVFTQAASVGDLPIANEYATALVEYLCAPAGSGGPFPIATSFMFCDTPPVGSIDYGTSYPTDTESATNNILITDHFKKEFKNTLTTSDQIGTVIRTLGFGGRFVDDSIDDTRESRSVLWSPLLQDDSPHKPVQTIHNHSQNAVEWGLDVDFLATGQGEITIDGSSWVQSNYPEFWRIDYTKTGNVGVSNYAYRTRKTLGFEGNTYNSPDDRTKLFSKQQGTAFPDRKTVAGGHGLITAYEIEEYNVETLITWDLTGITFTNINKCDSSLSFDASTSPSLPATKIQQVATDSDGNVWVACANTGLYRITDPVGSPVVELMTAGNGMPGTNNAYAVAQGSTGSVWAVVDGGLITTSAPSAVGVAFTIDPFTFVGISDSNWNTVRYMRIDIASPDNQMALVQHTGLLEDSIVWYSNTISALLAHTTSVSNIPWGWCNVGIKGHYWMHTNTDDIGGQAIRLHFGEAGTGPTDGSVLGRGYVYDYYGVPYFLDGPSNDSGYQTESSLNATNRSTRSQMMGVDGINAGYYGASFVMQSDDGDVMLEFPSAGLFRSPGHADFVGQPISFATHGNDSLNGQHSPFEEFMWSKYHWDGAAWTKNYFAQATDTATIVGGPYPAERHNFDTETHTFTGRSMIDHSAAFVTGNFNSTATIAMKINNVAKKQTDATYPEQETEQALFSIFANDQLISIYLDNGSSNIILAETIGSGNRTTHTFGSTPTTGIDHRVVITFNGTSVSLYVDGSLVGAPAVLTQAIDWSNPTAGLVSYIGCTVYPDAVNTNEIKQRITPQPSSFFRGVMENVQVWNTTWALIDVTNDNASPNGVISSQPPVTAMVARYELTQSLEGLETKPTHLAAEILKDTITIAFADGASGDAFVATDYHTFGLVDGVLKDNAIAFDHTFSMYFTPTDYEFGDFKNGANGDTVSATPAQITESVKFVNHNGHSASGYVSTTDANGIINSTPLLATKPGEVGHNSNAGSTAHIDVFGNPEGVMAGAPITSDGWIEFRPGFIPPNAVSFIVGLSDQTFDNIHVLTDRFSHGYKFNDDGTVDVMEAFSITPTATNITTFDNTDKFKIVRTGTVITLEKTDALAVTTTVHTSAKASSGIVYPRISIYQYNLITDCVINYTLPPNVMLIGDSGTQTGIFDDNFIIVDTHSPETIEIFIDGAPADVNISNTHFDGMTIPAVGEVTINGRLGWLLFNPADVGKVITGKVVTIYGKE